ncbi:MAG TPA: VRR-NUC domain-containing protein [Candidatus Brocadiaceae bacterium]
MPNGGFRNGREARNLKLQGVSAGVPDIMLAIPNETYHGLFIELKSKNGKLSEHQKEKFITLTLNGYKVSTCYSLEEAIETVKNYMVGCWQV